MRAVQQLSGGCCSSSRSHYSGTIPTTSPRSAHLPRPQRQRRQAARAQQPDRDGGSSIPPPPMPPMPPPPPPGQQQQQQQQLQPGFSQQQRFQQASATPRFQDLGWRELKERYVRPTYLPLSFGLGALTIGLRLSAANFTFSDTPLEFLGTAVSTGVMCMALAWTLFDFDEPAK